jgi:hypothetical protein
MPRTVILYIAERCNQSCVFCLEEDGAWTPFVDPTTTEVIRQLDRLWDRGARHITFMGGETFFRKDLGRILAHTRALGFRRIGVTTNGTVLHKPGFLRDLVAHGLEFIEISIHGHTPELANLIGGTHFTFERQALALAEINAIGALFTIVNVVVCRENKDHLLDVARYVCETFPGIPARFKFKFVSLQGLAAENAQKEQALGYDEVDAIAVGDYLAARGSPFWFYNFPLCRLGPHAARAHEIGALAADERYFDLDHRGADGYYDSGHQLEGRVWPGPSCAPCALRPICPGMEEQHRAARGAAALSPQSIDPLPLVASALEERSLPSDRAANRLEELRLDPRPERFVADRVPGAVRFRHEAEPHPLDIEVDEKRDGARAFVVTPHYLLSYRPWPDVEATSRPRVAALLKSATDVLRALEARPLAEARTAIAAAAASEGWIADLTASRAPAPRRKGFLPVLPDLPLAAPPRQP